MSTSETIDIAGTSLEYIRFGRERTGAPLVFLHEGVGSVDQWKDFPRRVADALSRPALVYSRLGYGRSSPLAAPRNPDYMHDEALVTLPALLDRLELERPILIGHSDGASIALIHAGAARRPVCGLVALAPHVFVEDVSIASIARAKELYETTDLRARLARYHDDVDSAFRGWNDIWLAPAFREWSIERVLATIECPVLLIQGRDDEYGTIAQVDAIERQLQVRVERILLERCGHSAFRDAPDATLEAVTRFIASCP